jgi:hypothetical protein
LACVLLALVCVAGASAESSALVQKSWVSQGSGTPPVKLVEPGAVTRVYANFVWAKAPTAGQKLRIRWIDPSGAVRAVWSGRTLTTDRTGDRLYSWIDPAVLATAPGVWKAALAVGGIVRGTRDFAVAQPA